MSRWQSAAAAILIALPGYPARVSVGQTLDHWETVVFDHDVWRYVTPDTEPDREWAAPTFDDAGWSAGPGGLGYGDEDDGTAISPVLSVYQRIRFSISDTSRIGLAALHVDYDDAFVAYLNGTEIARGNIGNPGDRPSFDQPADGLHEAELYRGIVPRPVLVRKSMLGQILEPGGNVLAVQTHNESLSSSDLSSRVFLSVGVTDTTRTYRSTPSWFTAPDVPSGSFSSTLPIIVIDTDGQVIPDEPKVRARMGIVDNGPGNLNSPSDPFNAYDGHIGVELRGRSTLAFPKNSLAVETRDAAGNDIDVSLLGLPEEEDWVLYAPYSDKSLMRNALIFRLSNRLGRYASRTRFVELVINEDYRGVYVLMERIKRDRRRVDISSLNPDEVAGDDLTGGYIIKIDDDEGGWTSPYPARPGLARQIQYRYHYPETQDIGPEQQVYIRGVVTAFEDAMASDRWADPASGYAAHIDVDAAVDYVILHELARNVDSYRLSMYMHKDRDSIGGGKLVFGPLWDFNFSFGNVDYYGSGNYAGFQIESGVPDYDGSHPPFWWKKLWRDAEFNRRVTDRWMSLRQGPLHTDSLTRVVDEVATLLAEPAVRNFDRWPVLGTYVWPNAYIGQTFDQEVAFLRRWLVDRVAWIDANVGNVVGSTTPSLPGAGYSLSAIHPSPFADMSQTRLTVDSTQHVRADVYDTLGRHVLTLWEGRLERDEVRQLTLDGRRLSAGVYVVRVVGETFRAERTAVVVK